MFEQKYEKYNFLSETYSFSVVKFSVYLKRRVFVMKQILVIGSCSSMNGAVSHVYNQFKTRKFFVFFFADRSKAIPLLQFCVFVRKLL